MLIISADVNNIYTSLIMSLKILRICLRVIVKKNYCLVKK